jgi:hypothetical protein
LPDESAEWQAAIDNIASALAAAGRLEEALPLYEEGMVASERTLGPEHPSTLVSVNNLGATLREKGVRETSPQPSPCFGGP